MSVMDTGQTDTLVIVAKFPEPGTVKTRLGAVIGPARAAALYRAFLRDLAARFDGGGESGDTSGAPWTLRWAVAPGARPPEALRAIVGARARVFPQRGDDFADRLYSICEDARTLGARRIAIMSSDAPQIGTELVAAAFAALGPAGDGLADESAPKGLAATKPACAGWDAEGRDVAISPAEDGGYSLIALRLPEEPDTPPDLFRGITMSTATVLAETRARAATLGLRMATLAPTFDVDEAADLGRLWQTLRAAPRLAPRSYAALAALIAAPATQLRDGQLPGNEDVHGDIASHW
jgi:hypothetical protein